MNRISVNQSAFEYIRYLAIEPKMIYEDGKRTEMQDMSSDLTPIYNVTCVAKLKDGKRKEKPETIVVKVPMVKVPEIPDCILVGFENLTASAFVSNGWGQLSFAADRIVPAEKQGK